jgi:hypothetical protein
MDSFPDDGADGRSQRLSLFYLMHSAAKNKAVAALQDIVRKGR